MSGEFNKQEAGFSPRGEPGIVLFGELAAGPDHLPEGVVICHPHPEFGGDMNYPLVQVLARRLAESGWVTLRFNFRGVGRSQGFYGGGESEVRDVLGAVDYLREQGDFPVGNVSLIGYSFGAWVGLRAAGEEVLKKVVGVCLPAGLFDFKFLAGRNFSLLAVHGSEDQFTPVEMIEGLAAGLPGPGRVEIIPGGDHFLAGREEEVYRRIKDFLGGA